MQRQITKDNSALLIIDMSNDFVDKEFPGHNYCEGGYQLLPSMHRFIETCRNTGLNIIYTTHSYRNNQTDMSEAKKEDQRLLGVQHVEGSHGVLIHKEITPADNEPVIPKHYFSAFYGTNINALLRGRGIENIFIMGVTTDICCLAGARGAQMENYNVILVEDMMAAVAAPDIGYGSYSNEQAHRLAVNCMHSSGIDVVKSSDIPAIIERGEL